MSKKHAVVAQFSALAPAVQHASRIVAEVSMTMTQVPHVVFDIDDTLIFDNEMETPNVQIKHLLDVAKAYGAQIHLVTARMKAADVTRWTRDQLRRQGIVYNTLALAPPAARKDLASVAKWKHSQRAKHGSVLLSVGDQWGDMMLLETEEDIDKLDRTHTVERGPWVIVRPNDGVTQYGLKLMASR